MPKRSKQMPDNFESYEEAAEFWDAHDSTDFMDSLEEVEFEVDIQKRHYLIELDNDTATLLQERAKKEHLSPTNLASKLLHRDLVEAA